MNNWQDTLIRADTSIVEAIRMMNETAAQICLVADADGRLLGTVTDGDVRRGILRGLALDTPASQVMNPKPHVARAGEDRARLVALMRRQMLRAVPLVDGRHRVVGLEVLADLLLIHPTDNWVVVMAGGEGRRLLPLTKEVPKPLLKVGSRPIMETIIDRFVEAGFQRFFISVNYLADQVESYFGDGSARGVEIAYLREERKLGTAGPLRMLPERPRLPFFVINGDILTNVDLASVLDDHIRQQASATMCVREYNVDIPYGVVSMDDRRIVTLVEKPTYRCFINAGIYVLDPSVMDLIDEDKPHDMPDVFNELIRLEYKCNAFPIHDYWADIGRIDDFHQANETFSQVFP